MELKEEIIQEVIELLAAQTKQVQAIIEKQQKAYDKSNRDFLKELTKTYQKSNKTDAYILKLLERVEIAEKSVFMLNAFLEILKNDYSNRVGNLTGVQSSAISSALQAEFLKKIS